MKSFVWGLISPALGAIPFYFSVLGFQSWREEKFEEAKAELEKYANVSPEFSKKFEKANRDASRRVRFWRVYGNLALLIYAGVAFLAWAILLIFLPLSNS